MTPYLNVRCDFWRHPKTLRLEAILGLGAGALVQRLWAYCGDFICRDARLVGYTDGEIEALAKWDGEPGKALEAMARVGYMERKNGAWAMSKWKEHQGHIYAFKVRGKTAATARWDAIRRAKQARKGVDATSIASGGVKQCSNRTHLPTDPTYQPKGLGGRGGTQAGKTKGGDARANGRFPLPEFTELPRPLFGDKAKAMLEDCEAVIADIRKEGKQDLGAKDPLGNPVLSLLPEAKEAIQAWRKRMGQIRQARAG